MLTRKVVYVDVVVAPRLFSREGATMLTRMKEKQQMWQTWWDSVLFTFISLSFFSFFYSVTKLFALRSVSVLCALRISISGISRALTFKKWLKWLINYLWWFTLPDYLNIVIYCAQLLSWIHFVATYFVPLTTGHPPCKLLRSNVLFGCTLQNKSASPFLGLTFNPISQLV